MKQAGVPFFVAVGFGFSGSGKRCVQTRSRLRLTDRVMIFLTALFAMGLAALSASDLTNDTPFRIVSSDHHQIVLELDSPRAQIDTEIINGMSYNRISMDGAESSAREGYPELPIFSGLVAIPANADYSLSYEVLDTSLITSVKPRPVPADYSKDSSLSAVYFGDSPYPAVQVTSSEPAWLRDFRVLPLQICPFSWNPVNNTLSHYTNIRVTLELSYPEAGPILYSGYSYAFREVYAAQILNFSDYRSPEPEPKNARILLIHGDNSDQIFLDKLKEFVIWKRQKGFEVDLASTSVAGTANTTIKDYIQARYNSPATRPDYIILLGDVEGSFAVPTWFETDSGFYGEGDYPYTQLSGIDLLGDVFIGRISAENISQLGTIFNKIYSYEKTINTSSGAADWLDRMLIIGDPTESGISCAYVSHHIREIAEYAHPEYDFIENYESGFESTMNSGVNQGVGFFTYRGCYGVSGWTPSSSLINGYKLPHAVILTCDTGTFSGTSLSENFIRLGTEAIPAGAVTCIGMSTIGTHTAFNNALIAGITGGIFTHKMRNMGQALLNGKLYLHSLYNETQPDYVKAFTHWCNLMGDPTLETWVGIPAELSLELPDVLPQGTISFELAISDSSQNPVEGVCVTAFSPDQSFALAKAFTGPDGIAHLSFSEPLSSELLITASKPDFRPVQQTVSIDPAGSVCYAAHQVIDDGTNGSSGNGDGSANATETIALEVALLNSTTQDMSSVKATLSTDNPKVQMNLSQANYLAIGSGDTAIGIHPFTFSLDPDIAAVETIRFYLNLSGANALHYESVFTVEASNASLSVSNYLVDQSGNGILDPGETCSLSLQISNSSLYSAFGLTGELNSLNNLVSVSDSISVFGDVYPSQQSNSVTEFQLVSRPGLVPGMQIPLRLRLFNDAGFEQSCSFNLPVGTVAQNTPLGPDEYGYLIYDQTDTGFPECPVYDWVEISPELGGPGSLVPDLFDNGIGNTEGEYFNARALKTLDLPFMFPFYGIYYEQITVCVNGFIAFGVTKDGDFRNAQLPGGQGPSPMIAAFWDDLFMRGTAGIYQYFDPVNHRYIIQYHELKNGYDGDSPEEFQVIFYDPVFYPTGKGDGMIKIQYKTFNNVDIGGGGYAPVQGNYCTVGIKDHTNTRGLQYSFNNSYPQAAAALGNETALLITTVPHYYQEAQLVANDVFIDDLNSNGILELGETAGLGIELKNLGAASANAVSARLLSSSPYVSVLSNQSVYPAIPGFSSAVNQIPFSICVSDSCPVETRLTLSCEVSSNSGSWVYPVSFMVYKPGVALDRYYLSDTDSNSNGILEPGETAELIVNLKNDSPLTVRDFSCSLACTGEYVTLIDSNQFLSSILPHSTVQVAFRFSLSGAAILGSNLNFSFSFSGLQIAPQNTQITMRVGNTGLSNDFENNNGNFFNPPSANPWEWGVSEAAGSHSGTKVWATKLNQQYPNNWNCELISPPMYLGSNTYLEFWHYYESEFGADGGVVRISIDYGPWILLTPVGGYPCYIVSALQSPGYSGSSGWSFVQFDLSSYSSQNVRFNWKFKSNAQNQGQGWFIDDVYTIAYDNLACSLSGQVLLQEGEPGSVEIWITNLGGISAKANSTGFYQMYLPSGTHALQASAPGYQTATVSGLVLSQFTPLLVQDFSLIELKAISSFTPGHTIDAVQLSWQPPQEPYYPVTGYRVMRKLNAGAYEAVSSTQETSYTEVFGVPGSYSYYVQAIYEQGESLPGETYSVEFPFSVDPPVPAVTRLYANYPNPFNPKTTINFDLAAKTMAELRIFNLRGQIVKTLWKGELEAGNYKFGWDGRNEQNQRVASGIYFYRLTGKGFADTGKMALIK